jgi:hypothetical protein
MDNVCSDCGRKFLSDLRFCPQCGGDAIPPRTEAWHYQASWMIAFSDPVEEKEIKAFKQNGWVLLCLGILLIPIWLLGLDFIMSDLMYGDFSLLEVILFVVASGVLAMVFISVSFAFKAQRPGTQVITVLFIVVTLNAWNPLAWGLMVGLFIILVMLWAWSGGSRIKSDPTYLPLMSSLAIFSIVSILLWGTSSTMGIMF